VVPGAPAKSLGAEETFSGDLRTPAEIEPELLSQAARVASRLVRGDLCGRLVTLKVKYADFTLRSRQKRLPEPVADTDSIYEAARELLGRFEQLERGVRLTGVSVGELMAGPPPASLFPEPRAERRQQLEKTVASLRDRFGNSGVTRAALLRRNGRT
jgi:DNA polymerase-4